ncbi:NAD-dependent epimerase/dehydratase family protein [Aeromonas caviae]|uniref:NAD-dependent epimerase/dehydratase family protein n=1 Tax=Aeromonas caviae TaxID=648 RepID=UPI0029D934F4|nr:NAD-dependent epimerase/dehydratase family protein [Aeromonas caviae]MDX7730661.1 NAD-dependent epimerase/dehydratase family protein [Aeromonas caviae]
MKNKVLILGGSGFIGINLIENFLSNNHEVFVYGRNKPAITCHSNDFHFIEAEMSDFEKHKNYLKSLKIETAIYLINTFPVNSKTLEYSSLLESNKNFISELIDIVGRFIFFSSGGRVYKSSVQAHHESESLAAICDYGKSKIALEHFVASESQLKNKLFLIIRPSNPYGPYQSLVGGQGLIAVLIGRILSKSKVDIWGTGHEVRDYIYIKDFISLFYKLYNLECPKYNVYNIGSGVGVSTLTILEVVRKQLLVNDVKIRYLSSNNVVESNILCNNRILEEVGPINYTHLAVGVAQFIEWLEMNGLNVEA